jgi:hypothetical protein
MKKKTKHKSTFKVQGPDGRVHEMHNSHRANVQHLIDNDGDVDGYAMKYGGLKRAKLGDGPDDAQNLLKGVAGTPVTDAYGNDIDAQGNILGAASTDANGNPISVRPTDANRPLFNQQQQQFTGGQNPKPLKMKNKRDPASTWGFDKYTTQGIQFGNQFDLAKTDLAAAKASGDPNDMKNAKVHKGAATAGLVGAAIGETMEMGKLFGNAYRKINQDIQARDFEREQQAYAMQNASAIKPFRSDDSQLGGGTRAAYSKFGGKIKMKLGGKLGYVGDNGVKVRADGMMDTGGKKNVNAEGGEGYNDGMSSGVLHGPTHEKDGIDIAAPDNTVFNSKHIGLKVGDMMAMAANLPGGDYFNSVLAQKYKDPEKAISYNDAHKLFLTTKKEGVSLDNKILKLKKDTEEATEASDNKNYTRVDQVTNSLNAPQLEMKTQALEEEKARRLFITGPQGPIYTIAQKLKEDGAYGEDIKEEARAKYGKKIKIKLPMAGKGDKVYGEDGNDLEETGATRIGPQGLQQIEYKNVKTGATTWGLIQNGQPSVEHASQTIHTNPNDQSVWYSSLPDPTSPFNPKYAGPYATAKDTPGGYGDPNALNQVRDITGAEFPNAQLQTGVDPRSVKAVQQVQAKYSPNEVVDAYKQGYLRFNNAHKKLLQGTKEFKSLGRKGSEPEQQDYKILLDNPQLLLQGHQDDKWGKDAIKYQNVKFKKGEEKQYEAWMKDQRRVGNHFIDKDYTQGAGEQPIYWSADTSELDFTPPPGEKKPPYKPNEYKAKGVEQRDRRIYHEGLDMSQIAGNVMDLLEPIQAVPYIEDHGAKDAFAATTKQRYTDIQPQLNRLRRGTLAQTRNRGTSPVDQARAAQAYANEYEVANQVYGQKYNADNQIEQNYTNMQNELMMKAGTNKASALNTLAERTATRDWKETAMRRNAIAEIGNKYIQQRAEDRASTLYQNMYPDLGYDPYTGTKYQGNWAPSIGGGYPYNAGKATTNAGYDEESWEDADGHKHTKRTPIRKHGGKVTLPKTMPKKR